MQISVVVSDVIPQRILDVKADDVTGDIGPLYVYVHCHFVVMVRSLELEGRVDVGVEIVSNFRGAEDHQNPCAQDRDETSTKGRLSQIFG